MSRSIWLLCCCLVAAPGPLRAQQADGGDGMQLGRAELVELMRRHDDAARGAQFSDAFRSRMRIEGALLRTRLNDGDFQVGDQVALLVEGEPALSDTFVVRTGRVLVLPNIGEVPLNGVLRSELNAHLAREVGRYLREPRVRSAALIRLAVSGGITRPGFYTVPADALLPDLLMTAGGFVAGADLAEMRIERLGEVIWSGETLQQRIAEGRTLDQMSLQAGDQVVVPVVEPGAVSPLRSLLTTIPTLLISLAALAQLF